MAKSTCSVGGCGRPHYSRTWCGPHYSRWQKHGDVMPEVPIGSRQPRKGSCRVDDCDRPITARLLCVGHLRREDKHGDVLAHIPLKRPRDGSCSVPECEQPHAGLGWCETHYQTYRRYKLTPEAYDAMLARQGGGCAICHTPPAPPERLVVDHDHACCPDRKMSCGRCVRGLLCSTCNLMIGYAQDSPERLLSAVAYLEASPTITRPARPAAA